MNILNFLKELRESADIQYKIFTQGSCFRLYSILKTICPDAIAYWSDTDGHCLIKIKDDFYDIGGLVTIDYVKHNNYYKIIEEQLEGYKLLKYINEESNHSVSVEKYKKIEP